MFSRSAICLATLCWTANAALALSPHRLVVVVGQSDDPLVVRQNHDLQQDPEGLRERDVIVLNLSVEAARRERPELGVAPHAGFEVLLVGKDGGIKLRREKPVAVSEINALIDTMPMRRDEMKK